MTQCRRREKRESLGMMVWTSPEDTRLPDMWSQRDNQNLTLLDPEGVSIRRHVQDLDILRP